MGLAKKMGSYSNGLFLCGWNQFGGGLIRGDVVRLDRTLDRQVWKGLLTRSRRTGLKNCRAIREKAAKSEQILRLDIEGFSANCSFTSRKLARFQPSLRLFPR